MLESMVTHPRAHAGRGVRRGHRDLEGADAIMLSAETATVATRRAAEVMARISGATQSVLAQAPILRRRTDAEIGVGFPEALSDAAAMAAHALDARAIVAFTQSGFSARLISHQRPDVPIIAFTPSVEVRRRLALSWAWPHASSARWTPRKSCSIRPKRRCCVTAPWVSTT